MKLNVGCGETKIEGYRHCDIVAFPHIDYVCNAWEIPIPRGSVEEIYSRHMLEHLDLPHAKICLCYWLDLLVIGGVARVIIPDLEFHCRQIFMAGKSEFVDASNFDHAMAGFYGWSGGGSDERMRHRWGYTGKSIEGLMRECGFSEVKVSRPRACDLEAVGTK
jgi:hypothetical protein